MAVDVGDRIPDFALPTDNGGTLTTGDLAGRKAVLYFYPKDDTPGCTIEAQAFRDASADFDAAGVSIVGISADGVASHGKFKSKYGLGFTLLSDSGTTLAQAFGVWVQKSMYGKTYMGMERATFLLDEAGVIRKVWRKVKVPGHAADVLAAAKSL